ncbi:hypothetical protein [Flavobacterium sp.]
MEKTKLLTVIIIGLLLINLGTLGFLILGGPKGHRSPHGKRPEPRQVIIEKLHFDAGQQKEYDKLIQWHRGEIDYLDQEIRHKKYLLYTLLYSDSTRADYKKTKQRFLDDLTGYQMQVEEIHFKHFQDIRKLCNKEQLKDFDNMIGELPKIFAPKPHRPKHD